MKSLSISILALEETMVYTLAGPHDIFSSLSLFNKSSQVNNHLTSSTHIVGPQKGLITCYNGLAINCQKTLEEVSQTDLIIIPSLELPDKPLLHKYPELKHWLKTHHNQGATIACICLGSFLLAETGLLDHKISTTHWAFSQRMQTTFPAIEILSDKIITEQNNLICSGGATSWQDLTSYLIKKFTDSEKAREINNFFLLNSHEDGQTPFINLLNTSFSNDLVIQKTCDWINNNLKSPDLLRASIHLSGLTERTYKRRFKKATGLSPLEYIQNTRIEHAKKQLENTKKTIQTISEEINYNDGSYFRRLFKRKTGMTAQNYRKRFSTLNSAKNYLKK